MFGHRNAGRSVELNGLLRTFDRLSQFLDGGRTIELFREESFCFAVEPCLRQASDDFVVLARIDTPIGMRGCNHRLDIMQGSVVADSGRLETRPRGWRL